ncbi:MAG: DUF4332 domain-containing protein [Gammaproteobacteria bacterium]|nr:DUF4332 domain-containing protein [Gammaproteobacteria bacterium]
MAEKKSDNETLNIARHREALSLDTDILRRSNLKATDVSRLVEVEGKLGVFTPVTDAEQPEETQQNLEQVVQVLRDEVARLHNDNLALEEKLRQVMQAQHRTPDDFATAVSHSVDSLQSRLLDTKNPVSRFALRTFEIEANVHVSVSSLGTVDYRFLEPEEQVDPNRLSKIKMSLVPLPRETAEGSWASPSFTPFQDIEEIQGIGEIYQDKLNSHNIYSISDLLNAGTRLKSRTELAAMLEVDRNDLAQWLSHAELMTVKEVDGRKAEVLHELGIDSLEKLSTEQPEALLEAYNAKVQELGRKTLKPVDEAEVKRWVEAASAFSGKSSSR